MDNSAPEQLSDEALVQKALENSGFFGDLMARYEDRLLNFIKRISGYKEEDAQDILQEAFIKAYFNLNDFDPRLKFSAWIYRIARNEAISEWRKRKSRPHVYLSDDDWHKIESESDLAGEVHQFFDREMVKRIFDSMPEKYSEVLVLKYFEDRGYEEISDILEKPLNTVGTLIFRAKKLFKEEYEKRHKQ